LGDLKISPARAREPPSCDHTIGSDLDERLVSGKMDEGSKPNAVTVYPTNVSGAPELQSVDDAAFSATVISQEAHAPSSLEFELLRRAQRTEALGSQTSNLHDPACF
jgi:hypothetical protein